MDLTAGKRTTGATNCTKLASRAGENATNGGMSMSIAGIATMIGMIAITRDRSRAEAEEPPADGASGQRALFILKNLFR